MRRSANMTDMRCSSLSVRAPLEGFVSNINVDDHINLMFSWQDPVWRLPCRGVSAPPSPLAPPLPLLSPSVHVSWASSCGWSAHLALCFCFVCSVFFFCLYLCFLSSFAFSLFAIHDSWSLSVPLFSCCHGSCSLPVFVPCFLFSSLPSSLPPSVHFSWSLPASTFWFFLITSFYVFLTQFSLHLRILFSNCEHLQLTFLLMMQIISSKSWLHFALFFISCYQWRMSSHHLKILLWKRYHFIVKVSLNAVFHFTSPLSYPCCTLHRAIA